MTGLVWLAKNTVAFFNTSLSSLRMRFSRRSRSFYWARLKSSFDIKAVFRCVVIQLFSVDMPTSGSSVPCFRVSPLVSAIRTASWRNSSVRFSPITSLLCFSKCYQRSGIKPRQVQRSTGASPRSWIAISVDQIHRTTGRGEDYTVSRQRRGFL